MQDRFEQELIGQVKSILIDRYGFDNGSGHTQLLPSDHEHDEAAKAICKLLAASQTADRAQADQAALESVADTSFEKWRANGCDGLISRYTMEELYERIGRGEQSSKQIHHKDDNPRNNDLKNVELRATPEAQS